MSQPKSKNQFSVVGQRPPSNMPKNKKKFPNLKAKMVTTEDGKKTMFVDKEGGALDQAVETMKYLLAADEGTGMSAGVPPHIENPTVAPFMRENAKGELAIIKQKFGSRDFIEINDDIQDKVISWLGGTTPWNTDLRQTLAKLNHNGFFKFLDKGVLIVRHDKLKLGYSIYPFEFTDYGTMKASIYISDPKAVDKGELHPLALLCKVEVGKATEWKLLDKETDYNYELWKRHLHRELELLPHYANGPLVHLVEHVREHHPEIKPDTQEFDNLLGKAYVETIIKAQVVITLGVHAYLALLEKDILISKIKQERIMTAGSGAKKNNSRNVAYRYVVGLPPNYKPRKFELNYEQSEWERAAHMATRWVRQENVHIYEDRPGYMITDQIRGDYVAVRVPIPSAHCERSEELIRNKQVKNSSKTYKL